ncbi:MLO-like protein 1 [Syzygium oleosum]|uniref:MLO-like protein 1 n=1 Tax=Syzygium oleosum TaxID=219896 RepID=UPI0024B8BFE9|nr:MLO-like protein 1 [Syzygium oleosum]
MADAGAAEISLEFTPSWVVALVCFFIVLISILVDRFLLCAGQLLQKRKKWPLVGALQKIKEELMLLGFISLLLAVFQTRIGKICISDRLANSWLPCKKPNSSSTVASFTTSSFASSGARGRRLLAEASDTYCSKNGKVPLLSVEALHHLDIFIFVLATFHVVLCVLKVLLGYAKIRQLSKLEEHDVGSTHYDTLKRVFTEKLRDYNNRRHNESAVPGWAISFFKQFYPSVTEFEYIALRLNFMFKFLSCPQAHDLKDPKKDFQKYIIGAVQKDFEKMVGISWYLWLCAVIFLLVNVAGWHAYFWISFIPFTLLLIVGTKLEHMITQLAKEVAKKHSQNENNSPTIESAKELVVKFSEDKFWFGRPHLVRNLIHIVLFENSLELAFFFFILFQYDFHSCVMGKVGFVVPRIAIGVFVQFMCIFRTLPLYAIMKSQMHPKENQSDEEEDMWIVTRISKWIDDRKNSILTKVATNTESTQTGSREGSAGDEITESSDMNAIGDIEAQNR